MAGLGGLVGGLLGGSRAGGSGGLSSVLGGLTGGSGGGAAVTALLPMVTGMLGGGGLSKIVSGFQSQGLSGQANSWIGKGPNQAVSGDQVSKVVGSDKIAEIAQKLGVSNSEAASSLAALLPNVINHVTPKGKIPAANKVDKALNKLQQAAAQAK